MYFQEMRASTILQSDVEAKLLDGDTENCKRFQAFGLSKILIGNNMQYLQHFMKLSNYVMYNFD